MQIKPSLDTPPPRAPPIDQTLHASKRGAAEIAFVSTNTSTTKRTLSSKLLGHCQTLLLLLPFFPLFSPDLCFPSKMSNIIKNTTTSWQTNCYKPLKIATFGRKFQNISHFSALRGVKWPFFWLVDFFTLWLMEMSYDVNEHIKLTSSISRTMLWVFFPVFVQNLFDL